MIIVIRQSKFKFIFILIIIKTYKNSDQPKQKGIEFNKSNLPSYISNYNINRNELKKLEAKCN